MTHTNRIHHLLLLPVLLASAAFAQNGDGQVAVTARGIDQVEAARGQYMQTSNISPDTNDGKTLAQLPRRGPGMPFPRQRGYPRGIYATSWMDHGDAGHVLVGAAIGSGLGALVGVKANKDPHPGATAGAVVIFGGLGALMGGLIGGSHPMLHARRVYRPS
jgi:hypothetical protein